MKTLIKLIIAAVVINAVYRSGSVALKYYQFKDQTEQMILFGQNESVSSLTKQILEEATKRSVPLDDEGLTVTRQGGRTVADVDYSESIEVFPRIFYPVKFSFSAEGFGLAGADAGNGRSEDRPLRPGAGGLHTARLESPASTAAARRSSIPASFTRLVRACAPPTIATAPRGRSNVRASSATSSSLAAPSTGGECSRARSTPSGSTVSDGFEALGTTLTVTVTPPGVGRATLQTNSQPGGRLRRHAASAPRTADRSSSAATVHGHVTAELLDHAIDRR